MVSLTQAIRNQAVANYCLLTVPVAVGLQAADRRFGDSFEENGDELLDGAIGLFRNAQQLYCNRFPNSRAELEAGTAPPFSGGQCSELYRVNVDVINNGVTAPNPITYTVFGPVRGIGTREGSSSGTLWFIRHTTQQGEPAEQNIQDNTPITRSFAIRDVELFDGGEDNCGDPPGELPPYNPEDNRVEDVPVTYDDENGDEQTTNVDFEFGPLEIGPDGEFSIPVDVTFDNGSEITLDLDLTNDDVSGPTAPPEEENQPLAPGTDPEEVGVLIKAVVVSASYDEDVSDATEIFQSGTAPNIYAPRLGYVTFMYRLANGRLVFGQDIPVKRRNQIIFCPEPAVNVFGNPNVGSSFELTVIPADSPSCC